MATSATVGVDVSPSAQAAIKWAAALSLCRWHLPPCIFPYREAIAADLIPSNLNSAGSQAQLGRTEYSGGSFGPLGMGRGSRLIDFFSGAHAAHREWGSTFS
jgi:hypothetical protein